MMFTPCGPSAVPTGGAGVALPAGSSILSTARTFFFPIPTSVNFLDLQEVELDRRLPAEHVDEHLQLALLGVDLVDLAEEVGEGAVHDADALAQLELDPDLRLLLDLLQDRAKLVLVQRDRLVAGADEAGHPWRVPDDVPGLVGHHHLDQDVTGEDPLLDVAALAVLDLDLILCWDQDLEDLVVHVHRVDPLLEVLLDLLLVAGVGVDHVPLRLFGGGLGCRSFGGHGYLATPL